MYTSSPPSPSLVVSRTNMSSFTSTAPPPVIIDLSYLYPSSKAPYPGLFIGVTIIGVIVFIPCELYSIYNLISSIF